MKDHLESDIGVASFLVVRGFKLLGLVQVAHNRYAFRFADPYNNAAQIAQSFFDGSMVEAKAVLDALKNLKAKLYGLKGIRNEHRNHQYASN